MLLYVDVFVFIDFAAAVVVIDIMVARCQPPLQGAVVIVSRL